MEMHEDPSNPISVASSVCANLSFPIQILAVFVAIFAPDPAVGHKWLKTNRLSLLSIPFFKAMIVENVEKLIAAKDALNYTEEEVNKFRLLAEKLEPLRGC